VSLIRAMEMGVALRGMFGAALSNHRAQRSTRLGATNSQPQKQTQCLEIGLLVMVAHSFAQLGKVLDTGPPVQLLVRSTSQHEANFFLSESIC